MLGCSLSNTDTRPKYELSSHGNVICEYNCCCTVPFSTTGGAFAVSSYKCGLDSCRPMVRHVVRPGPGWALKPSLVVTTYVSVRAFQKLFVCVSYRCRAGQWTVCLLFQSKPLGEVAVPPEVQLGYAIRSKTTFAKGFVLFTSVGFMHVVIDTNATTLQYNVVLFPNVF